MKKILIITALFLTTARLFAQDCLHYVFMKKGRTIETTSYDGAGKVMHKVVMLVNDVATTSGIVTATINAQNFNAKGTPTSNNAVVYKCDNGALVIDVSSLMPQQPNFKFSTAIMKYPADMTVGEHFDNVTMNMEWVMGGKTIRSNCQVTDRTVVDEENLTTPAGTWKCFKMTYKLTATYTGLNMPPSTITATEWYAPDFAIVQWQMGAMITKITAIKD